MGEEMESSRQYTVMSEQERQEQDSGEEDDAAHKAVADDHELHLPIPLHVAMKIFVHLPVNSIAQLKLVCKPWNSMFSSPSFLAHLELESRILIHGRPRPPEWWFVMSASTVPPFSHDLLAFSHPLWKPFRLPLHSSSKLGDLLLRVASSQSLVPSVVNLLVASAGGLMCAVVKGVPQSGFRDRLPDSQSAAPLPSSSWASASAYLIGELTYDIVVFNCLTGELSTLPRPARLANKLISSCLISMKAEEVNNTYEIIVSDLKYREMEIYSSRTRRWRAGVGVRSCHVGDVCSGGTATAEELGIAELLAADLVRYHKEEIAAFDAKQGRWRKTEVALPRCIGATELLRSTVVKCWGGMYLVACLMRQAERMEGYGVWRLVDEGNGRGLGWEEWGRTPAAMVERLGRRWFESPAFYDCRFVGGGADSEWVCMTGAHYVIGSRSQADYWLPVLFNVRHRQWHLLPPRHGLCLFPFQPRYTALP
ncbi:hypothetical protein KP509_26G037100 [Ceratopteris richardii]|uniref:F-box domain-containing protein n=1 Tax=Ceratopteris richardii TaxID=49495 RepID=A0A8T2RLP7_CERRI|nr:hypothetical protein KP509_26G037100 [Ceratopteris richardii]